MVQQKQIASWVSRTMRARPEGIAETPKPIQDRLVRHLCVSPRAVELNKDLEDDGAECNPSTAADSGRSRRWVSVGWFSARKAELAHEDAQVV